MIERPEEQEYDEFYQGYVDKVKNKDIIDFLKVQKRTITRLLNTMTDDSASYRYAADKWSIKQVLRHIIDAEIVFAYRVHAISRGVAAELPGMDQDDYMSHTNDSQVSLEALIEEFNSVRKASIILIEHLDESVYTKMGKASGYPVSVRGMIYILAGHAEHHKSVLKEKYLTHV